MTERKCMYVRRNVCMTHTYIIHTCMYHTYIHFGPNPEKIEILFDDLIDLVLADGAIDFGEIDVLVRLRKILRLSETYFVTTFAIKVASAAGKGKVNVTLYDLDKSPEEVLQEITAETIEELEEAA